MANSIMRLMDMMAKPMMKPFGQTLIVAEPMKRPLNKHCNDGRAYDENIGETVTMGKAYDETVGQKHSKAGKAYDGTTA